MAETLDGIQQLRTHIIRRRATDSVHRLSPCVRSTDIPHNVH